MFSGRRPNQPLFPQLLPGSWLGRQDRAQFDAQISLPSQGEQLCGIVSDRGISGGGRGLTIGDWQRKYCDGEGEEQSDKEV